MIIEFTIHGRVQGVGYRYFTLEAAQSLGISGFVRNAYDGTVTGLASGEITYLEQFKYKLEQGPSLCRITRLDWNQVENQADLPFPFEIR